MFKKAASLFIVLFASLSELCTLPACESHTDEVTKLLEKKQTNNSKWILENLKETSFEHFLENRVNFTKIIYELSRRYRFSHLDAVGVFHSDDRLLGMALAYELHVPFVDLSITTQSSFSGKNMVILTNIVETEEDIMKACKAIENCGAKLDEIACLIEMRQAERSHSHSPPVFSLVIID